jgi:LysR family glycine cleavage system transcriptional activator
MPVKPPRPRGPHLNAMRCFEAAARLGGFAAAGEELSVTPGAVSQQVKALEEWIGAPLFERRSQGVALTKLGESVADEFGAAFDALGTALHRLRAEAPQQTISIAALPSVAQLWLSPRLPAVRDAFPDHQISITALEVPPNLRRGLFDLSFFVGVPTRSKTERILADDVIFPVCAPAIAQRLKSPDDLAGETLVFDSTWVDDWAQWMAAAGMGEAMGQEGPTFSLYSIAVDEARNGAGVLMGHQCLVERNLASGELVAPFAQKISTSKSLILETATPLLKSSRLKKIVKMLTA